MRALGEGVRSLIGWDALGPRAQATLLICVPVLLVVALKGLSLITSPITSPRQEARMVALPFCFLLGLSMVLFIPWVARTAEKLSKHTGEDQPLGTTTIICVFSLLQLWDDSTEAPLLSVITCFGSGLIVFAVGAKALTNAHGLIKNLPPLKGRSL